MSIFTIFDFSTLPRLLHLFFFFNDTATTEIYTLSLHDALPICSSRQQAAEQRQQLLQRPHRVVTHVSDPDGRVLERAVARADRPAFRLQPGHDGLGALPLSQLEAGDGPATPALTWEEGDSALLAPRLHPLAHRVVAAPARLDPALALDARELGLERVQQGDRRRIGRLEFPGRLLEGDEVEVESAIGQGLRALEHPLRRDAERE